MPPAKLGYSSSVKRGSGSSRKNSFSVPAMAFTSISLIMTDTSLLSAEQERHKSLNSMSPLPAVFISPTFVKSLTRVKRSLQRLDVGRDTGHSVDSHLLHPPSLNLLHTLSDNEGNLGALSPRKNTDIQKLKVILTFPIHPVVFWQKTRFHAKCNWFKMLCRALERNIMYVTHIHNSLSYYVDFHSKDAGLFPWRHPLQTELSAGEFHRELHLNLKQVKGNGHFRTTTVGDSTAFTAAVIRFQWVDEEHLLRSWRWLSSASLCFAASEDPAEEKKKITHTHDLCIRVRFSSDTRKYSITISLI